MKILSPPANICMASLLPIYGPLRAHFCLLQVRHRFLKCVTLTCFYIAAKLEEKAEVSSYLQLGGEEGVWLEVKSESRLFVRNAIVFITQ